MNPYELMLTLDPGLGEEKIGETVSKIEEKIKSFGGQIEKTEKWGVKKLSSVFKKAKKMTQGYFVLVFISGQKDLPAKVQQYLKVTEEIVRYSLLKGVEPEEEAEIAGTPVEKEAPAAVEIAEAGELSGQP